MCYEQCRDGYSMPSSACGFCKADGNCPAGTTNTMGVCWKDSYGRGAGEPMKCGSGQEYDAGLCYPACPSGATGVGPLCYKDCPPDQPYRVGVWCYRSKSEADGIISAIVIGSVLGTALLVAAVVAGAAAAAGAAEILFVAPAVAGMATVVEVGAIGGAEALLMAEPLVPELFMFVTEGVPAVVLDLAGKSCGSTYAFKTRGLLTQALLLPSPPYTPHTGDVYVTVDEFGVLETYVDEETLLTPILERGYMTVFNVESVGYEGTWTSTGWTFTPLRLPGDLI